MCVEWLQQLRRKTKHNTEVREQLGPRILVYGRGLSNKAIFKQRCGKSEGVSQIDPLGKCISDKQKEAFEERKHQARSRNSRRPRELQWRWGEQLRPPGRTGVVGRGWRTQHVMATVRAVAYTLSETKRH